VSDFLVFDEGARELLNNGLPATTRFLLSTKKVGTQAGGEHIQTDTLAGTGVGEITGTGYARVSQAEPTAATRSVVWSVISWSTGSATDWPAGVKSVVLVTTADNTGKAICAWNLRTGAETGLARDMSGSNTTENFTPTLTG
jgi:hypothetical protein